jgi:hypothetical protein
MHYAVKILLPAAAIAAALGAFVASSHQQAQPVAIAIKGETANTAQRSADDALKADPSWIRWPSVTDF